MEICIHLYGMFIFMLGSQISVFDVNVFAGVLVVNRRSHGFESRPRKITRECYPKMIYSHELVLFFGLDDIIMSVAVAVAG